jgi:hypothetical protein
MRHPQDMQPIPLRADPGALTRRNVAALTRAMIVKATAKLELRRDERAILKERWPDDPIASRARGLQQHAPSNGARAA